MRPTLRRNLILLLILCGVPPAVCAQTPVTPPRDPSAVTRKGTAVITGRVMAADGRPLRRARVSLTSPDLGADGRRSTSTGVDGRYTLKDLPAARYRITVTRGGYLQLEYGQRRPGEQGRPLEVADGQTLERIDFTLPRMGMISGRITDETGDAIEGVSVYAMREMFFEGRRRLVPVSGVSVRTDDEGEYRIPRLAPGSYQVMASTKDTWTVVEHGKETVYGYLQTYFPGVAAASDTRRVRVAVGEQVRAIDFSLVPGRAAKISGTALDSQGSPFDRVSLTADVRGLGFASFGGGPEAAVNPDGTFAIRDVPPGDYTLQAVRRGNTGGEPEVALVALSVEGTDIDNIVLTGSGGGTLSGRVVPEEGSLPKVSGIHVNVGPTYRNQAPPVLLGVFRDTTRILEDGSFTVKHVFGRSRVRVTLPEGWMVKSIRRGDKDLTDAVLDLRSGEELAGVEILITNKVTEVSGQVTDEKLQPTRDATVRLFPADADLWFENSPRMRAARPDQEGKWRVKALPTGEYLAIALDYVETDTWQDPELLESFRERATKLTVTDGSAQTVSLKLVKQ